MESTGNQEVTMTAATLAEHMVTEHDWTIYDHERDDLSTLRAMHRVAVENNPGSPCVHEHNWLVLVAQHGPDAPYGCQQCPATATGREIGVA